MVSPAWDTNSHDRMRPTAAACSSPLDFHTLRLHHSDDCGGLQEHDKRSYRFRWMSAGWDTRNKPSVVLQLIRQGDERRASLAHDLANLREAERTLSLSKRDFRHIAARSESNLGFQA